MEQYDKYKDNNKFKIFEKENDYGMIEYKSKISWNSSYKVYHLISQIKYRINEGNGTAIYVLCVNDTGTILDLTKKERNISLQNFKKLMNALNFKIKMILHCVFLNRFCWIIKIYDPNYKIDFLC